MLIDTDIVPFELLSTYGYLLETGLRPDENNKWSDLYDEFNEELNFKDIINSKGESIVEFGDLGYKHFVLFIHGDDKNKTLSCRRDIFQIW